MSMFAYADTEVEPSALLSEEDLRDRNAAAIWSQVKGSITPHAVAVSDPKVRPFSPKEKHIFFLLSMICLSNKDQ